MVDGVFDNLTVNLLSKLKGKVGIGTQDDLRVGYDYLSNKLEVKGGNVGIFGRLFVEPGQGEEGGHEITPEVGLDGISIDRDDETGIIYLQGYRDHFDDGYEPIPLALQPQGGNVGIGTTSPSEKLTIQGDSSAPYALNVGGISNARIKVRHLDGKDYQSGNLDNLYLQYGVSHHTILNAGGSNGNVGIGTDSPSEKLTIQGDSSAPYALNVGGISNARIKVRHLDGKDHQSGNLDNLYLQYGVSHHTILNAGGSNGNVGIGTTSPSEKLEVNGNIKVTGDIFLTNADCAEEFDVVGAESVEPGTVMVIDRDGGLRPSEQPYDKRVAGVISGAVDLRPGITLDKKSEQANRLPLALTGKVYCKIDAQYGSVDVGDLLTTSPTAGHAMKASDPFKAFGSVIGKALRPIEMGRELIPILVALQ